MWFTDSRYWWLGCTRFPPCNLPVSRGLLLFYCAETGFYLQAIHFLTFHEVGHRAEKGGRWRWELRYSEAGLQMRGLGRARNSSPPIPRLPGPVSSKARHSSPKPRHLPARRYALS